MTGVCSKKLSQNQFLFCEEYLIHGNGTRAYKTAYPGVKKDSTAAAAATRLLKKVKISAYLEKRKSEIAARLEITPERTLRAYARRAYFDPRQLVDEDGKLIPLHRLHRDVAAPLTKIKVRRLKTKTKSLSRKNADTIMNAVASGIPLDKLDDEDLVVNEITKESILAVEWDKGDSARDALSKYQGLFEKDNHQRRAAALDEIINMLPEPVREVLRKQATKEMGGADE